MSVDSRRHMQGKFPWDLVWIAALLFVVAYLVAIGCASAPPMAQKPRSLCVIEPQTGMCWTSKRQAKGTRLNEMAGYYGLSGADLKQITTRLNWCQDHPLSPASEEIHRAADLVEAGAKRQASPGVSGSPPDTAGSQ